MHILFKVWYISIFISYIISLLVYSVIRKKTTSNSTDHAVLYKYNLLHISNYQFWIGPLQTNMAIYVPADNTQCNNDITL